MSNIPSDGTKIQIEPTQSREAVSESLLQSMGAAINYCIDNALVLANRKLKYVLLTSNTIWTSPSDCDFVFLQGIGGGAGGWNNNSGTCYAGSATRSRMLNRIITPSTAYNVVIGAGGLASDIIGNPSGVNYPGGATYFGTNKFDGGIGRSNGGTGLRNGVNAFEFLGGTQVTGVTTIGGGDASDFGNGGTLGGNADGYGAGGSGTGNGSPGFLLIAYFSSY